MSESRPIEEKLNAKGWKCTGELREPADYEYFYDRGLVIQMANSEQSTHKSGKKLFWILEKTDNGGAE